MDTHIEKEIIPRSEKVMKAIILSGGKGTRLKPLTDNIPKPMLPIGGKPHLEHIVELLKEHGVEHIIFSTGYLHEQIVEHFGDGSKYGIKIDYKVDGDKPLGTAGAIKNCEDFFEPLESFIVFNGDILTDIDLSMMVFQHLVNFQPLTIALVPVEEPSQFGVAVTEGDMVTKFIEKPPTFDYGNLINAGVYIMDKEVLEHIPKNEYIMVETDVFPHYADEGRLLYYKQDGMYWIDIGTHDRYDQANKDFKKNFNK
jgi:mannose-1-phosphate guanylyltransferase